MFLYKIVTFDKWRSSHDHNCVSEFCYAYNSKICGCDSMKPLSLGLNLTAQNLKSSS